MNRFRRHFSFINSKSRFFHTDASQPNLELRGSVMIKNRRLTEGAMSRRQFLKRAGMIGLGATSALFFGNCMHFHSGARQLKRRIYWWIGMGLRMFNMKTLPLVNGLAYGGEYDPELEAKKGFRLVKDYGDMDHDDSTNDVEVTISELRWYYERGARLLSTDLEWGHFDNAETRQFLDAIRSMPGLTVLQWNGWWNWKQPERDLLEQCDQLVLAEMIYPLVEDENMNYDAIYKMIEHGMSHYTFKTEQRHAIGLSTVFHGPKLEIKDPDPLPWEKIKRQIDAAIAYGNAIGHPRQAIAFYYPVPPEYADKINRYTLGIAD
jgi:hypothetical protein